MDIFINNKLDDLITPEDRAVLRYPLRKLLEEYKNTIQDFNKLIATSNRKDDVRERVVNNALLLTNTMEQKFGVKLPFMFTGGHRLYSNGKKVFERLDDSFVDGETYGVNGSWGSSLNAEEKSIIKPFDHDDYISYGLDCSGYLAWVLYNSGFKFKNRSNSDIRYDSSSSDGISPGKLCRLKESLFIGKPGDLLSTIHHIMIIVNVDYDKGLYYISESGGFKNNMMVRKISFTDIFASEKDYAVIDMTDYYGNEKNYVKIMS